jgi:hypothetical protein
MTGPCRLGVLSALLPLLAALLMTAPAAQARGGGDRVEARVDGVCGRASHASLRLRAEDGRIRVDMRVGTRKTGRWRVRVFHERRLVKRTRVRATRARGGFEYRVFLPDFAGPDAIRVRALAPSGETCSAGATVSDPTRRAAGRGVVERAEGQGGLF